QRDRDVVFFDQRFGHLVNRAVAVVDGDNHGFWRRGRAFSTQIVHQVLQGNHAVTLVVQELQLLLKHGRGGGHAVGDGGSETVVAEDGHGDGLVIRIHREDAAQQQGPDQPDFDLRTNHKSDSGGCVVSATRGYAHTYCIAQRKTSGRKEN